MPAAPLDDNERERLETLARYAILDTLPEQQFDDLTFLAAQICGTPISLLSLVDRDRQWFKSHRGLEETETSRAVSFCAHAILNPQVMEVPDATQDARFSDNLLVTSGPEIRFYAGAPLITPEGFRMGTLCVIDTVPRTLSSSQLQSLEALARQSIAQMEMWRTVRHLEIASVERSIALQVAHDTANRLAESETRFRQFMDNSPAMALIKDGLGRYVYVNKPLEQTFNVSFATLKGKTDLSWLPQSEAEAVMSNDRKVLESGQLLEAIEVVTTPDGCEREWLVFKFPIEAASGERHLGVVGLDVTEQRRASRLKSEFVSVVSHELRTPLTSIRGALGLLAGGVAGELSAAARQMIEIAQKNGDRLVLLINDILDVEKIESGKMRFDLRPLDLRAVLHNALEVNAAYAQALDVRLELDISALEHNEERGQELNQRLEMMGDEDRLQQVLANLLSNAAKFTPSGGTVHLEARLLPESAAPGQGKPTPWVRISVRDEGSGVPEEFVPRLFEKFAQADASSTRKRGGTGLGLAIARAIVEKHDGFIRYLPPVAPLTGATFAFDLPLQRADGKAEAFKEAQVKEQKSENAKIEAVFPSVTEAAMDAANAPRILICEDDEEIAQILRLMVKQSGYDADIATTVKEARQKLSSQRYAGMTLDLEFPDGNGLELLAQVRAGAVDWTGDSNAQFDDQVRDLPVVVVSAHHQSGVLQGEAFEVLDWLQKPIDAERLLAALSGFDRRESAPRQKRSSRKPRLLHIEDDADVRQVMAAILGQHVEVVAATSVAQARARLEESDFDLAILDVALPDGSGLDLLAQLAAGESRTPVILFCAGEISSEQARLVSASLVKSRTGNDELREVIWRFLRKGR